MRDKLAAKARSSLPRKVVTSSTEVAPVGVDPVVASGGVGVPHGAPCLDPPKGCGGLQEVMQQEEKEESHLRPRSLHNEGRQGVHLQGCKARQAQVYRMLQDSPEPGLNFLGIRIQARICKAFCSEVGGGLEDSCQHFERVVSPPSRAPLGLKGRDSRDAHEGGRCWPWGGIPRRPCHR